ncbi:antibiotic biosynthesis monooxygenase [Psychromonas marina]|uniref:Antibiotic biosynthesis monooxygenase n=1 Tax=Psychromonas marina TaxID=88364 RepID=A0ABQ6E0I0_9GAMM|nr:putative quinol monooxygenase [Psychromonas marina]GLS90850.1 antibiotic biosynthesis monooxygenase [Psychromonas marina]
MTTLTIIASITANINNVELVKSELLKLITPTRAEAGCLQYDLHQDNENAAHFTVVENWGSSELLQAHIENTPFTNFMKVTEGAISEFAVNKMTKIA